MKLISQGTLPKEAPSVSDREAGLLQWFWKCARFFSIILYSIVFYSIVFYWEQCRIPLSVGKRNVPFPTIIQYDVLPNFSWFYSILFYSIAIVRQIFQNKVFFFTSWGSFPCKKKKKKVFVKNLPGASNILFYSILFYSIQFYTLETLFQ
jgi:hypothetical protein